MNDILAPKIPTEILGLLSEGPRACVQRLIDFFSSSNRPPADLSSYPKSKLGAVLVLLYEDSGKLRVLLTTRAKTLRFQGGQTALPGGMFEESDKNLVDTAYREAYEEVNLPLACPHIHTLGILEPHAFHSLAVTPVVALLTNSQILNSLQNEKREVDHIFTHPLKAIIDPTLAAAEPLVVHGSDYWTFDTKYHNHQDYVAQKLGGLIYRMHCFQTSASPIRGLTSDILIQTAKVAYAENTTYDRFAKHQLKTFAEMDAYLKARVAKGAQPESEQAS